MPHAFVLVETARPPTWTNPVHNTTYQPRTRDTDSNSSVDCTLTHDAAGNLTDDGKGYSYVSDAFGRLKTVKNRGNSAVVAEYTYNGLNMRIGWHSDADADADVDGSDPWYNFAHDDRWRIVATFRGSDTSPKELFAYHNAGANGRGGSSYIDSVILRNKDANTSWTAASDGTPEERVYYVQNWRADVSAVLSSAGLVKEWVKYTSYGIPIRIDPADYNRDGFVNGTDFDDYGDDFDNARAEADVNFDGSVNGDDYDLFSEWFDAPSTAGRFTLSASSVGNRIGYAGYLYDPAFVGASRAIFHVRHRVYDAGLGRWTRRDPIGYKAGVDLYAYVNDRPITKLDPMGLKPPKKKSLDPYGDEPSSDPDYEPTDIAIPIQVECWKIGNLPGSHCYITTPPDSTNPTTCSGYQPEDYPFKKVGDPIRAACQPWNESDEKLEYGVCRYDTKDCKKNMVETPIYCAMDTQVDMSSVIECLQDGVNRINACRIRYDWTGPNSNSVARCLLEKCLPSGCKVPNPPKTATWGWPWGWDSGHEAVCSCIMDI